MYRFVVLLFLSCSGFSQEIPRKIIAFWDSLTDRSVEDSLVHMTLEMPLNYLGLDVVYYDIREPLPDLSNFPQVRGVLVSFRNDTKMTDPKTFIEWAVQAIDLGKKVVLMGNFGFLIDTQGNYTPQDLQNELLERIGVISSSTWVDYPFDYQILMQSQELFPFEKKIPTPLPGFYMSRALSTDVQVSLRVGIPGKIESQADLVVISPRGAYVSPFYANNYTDLFGGVDPLHIGWYLNPFSFFEKAFATTTLPVADPTTLAGRRIYFSTCHGDGWNDQTKIESYKKQQVSCAQVILEKLIHAHNDFPFTVAVIAASVDPHWAAQKNSQKIAREYFALPNVEPASHTYSHPFQWDFFRKDGGHKEEIDYLYLYPYGSWQNSYLSWLRAHYDALRYPLKNKLKWGYVTPRAYANEPFHLKKEIEGSVEFLNTLAPSPQAVDLLIWSGDSLPWPEAVSLCQTAGIKNLGGGFCRFDPNYPSNLFVYPLGRKPGNNIQLYAASNGENSYTFEWKDQFYGFQYLPATLENTETPRRLKPIQLYFHSYSGEFTPSLDALLKNLSWIRNQNIIPIFTSRYTEIGTGFYSIQFHPLSDQMWKILHRGGLQTIRFFDKGNTHVDWKYSQGIVGYTKNLGSLYVYLDAAEPEPVIALAQKEQDSTPYLLESSWEVQELQREENACRFIAQGWGKMIMRWKVPQEGTYLVTIQKNVTTAIPVQERKILEIERELPCGTPIEMSFSREDL